MEDRLTSRQRRFAERYLAGESARQSALDAGYGEKTAGTGAGRLLGVPAVARYIERRQAEAAALAGPRRALQELAAIAFYDAADYAAVEDGRLTLRDTRALSRFQRAAIVGLREGTKGVEVKLADKLRALEILCRAAGAAVPDPAARPGGEGLAAGPAEVRIIIENGEGRELPGERSEAPRHPAD